MARIRIYTGHGRWGGLGKRLLERIWSILLVLWETQYWCYWFALMDGIRWLACRSGSSVALGSGRVVNLGE